MNDTDKLALEKGFSKNNSRSPIAAAAFAPKGRREDWRCRVRRTEASQYLLEVHGVATAPATLAKLAVVGGGPEYELWGRLPYYPTEGLDRWAEARLSRRRSTSDRGSGPDHQTPNAIAKQRASGSPASVIEADLINPPEACSSKRYENVRSRHS